jgi:hypothetical protein
MQFGSLAVDDNDIVLCMHHLHIVSTVIESRVAPDLERVALCHPHISEGMECVLLLFEVGTVAIESRSLMTELDMSSDDLGVTFLIVIKVKGVGVVKIDTLIAGPSFLSLSHSVLRHT